MSQTESLPQVALRNPDATANVYLNGAHVSSWVPKGQRDVLFMSAASHFAPGKAIRGGVPIIFPWFGGRDGYPQSPAHGFARVMPWNVVSVERRSDGASALTLELLSSNMTREVWPYDFALQFTIAAEKKLWMTLTVSNTGGEPFTFEEALHTYLSVGDVRLASITGLGGATFIDKVDGFKRKPQGPEPIVITGETDRVYLNTQSEVVVHDPTWARSLTVAKMNSNATVLWNPWIAKSKAMADFGDEEWPGMVCVETCNVADHKITLEPGKSHAMTAIIGVK
jgi:glucose-6-phosphate 1-epimerase